MAKESKNGKGVKPAKSVLAGVANDSGGSTKGLKAKKSPPPKAKGSRTNF